MKNIYKALADFQQEVPIIHKSTEGYGYSYADLSDIFEIINPILKKHGLGFTQLVNKDVLITIVFHIESGEEIKSETLLINDVKLAKMNDFQVLGSQITYLRRYTLSSMLGLVTDVDNDANGEQKTKSKTSTKPEGEKEPEKIWLNRNGQNGALLAAYTKVITEARKKGLKLSDMFKYYKMSPETQGFVKQDLGG